MGRIGPHSLYHYFKDEDPQLATLFLVYETFVSVVSLALLVGNGLVLYLFVRRKRLRRCPSNWLLFCLAIVDVMGGCALTPMALPRLAYVEVITDKTTHEGIFLGHGITVLSLYLLLGIAMDRFTAIRWPLHHNMIVTGNRVVLYIVLIIIITIASQIEPIVAISQLYRREYADHVSMSNVSNMSVYISNFESSRRTYMTYVLGVLLPPPVILITAFNIYIFKIASGHTEILRHHNRAYHQGNGTDKKCVLLRKIKSARKAVKFLGVILILFFLGWIPFTVTGILTMECLLCDKKSLIYALLAFGSVAMGISVINPWLHTLRTAEFRTEMGRMADWWRKKCPCCAKKRTSSPESTKSLRKSRSTTAASRSDTLYALAENPGETNI